jgi:hypothetical protein
VTLQIPPAPSKVSEAGSKAIVGCRFQSFEINRLEMVDPNIASWNQIARWLRRVEALR